MKIKNATGVFRVLAAMIASISAAASAAPAEAPDTKAPVKVFILAGDENVLEQGVVEGRTAGSDAEFYPGATTARDERVKHVPVAVYKGAYSPDTDYDKAEPAATGVVEIGDQQTRQAQKGKRGRVPVPMTPFPELAQKEGYTTVLRGYVSVRWPGQYEFLPGADQASFNVTSVEGKEVYHRDVGQATPMITPVQLAPKKRYAFRTVFFKKPGHDFRVALINKPGTLETSVAEKKERWGFLKNADGGWGKRDDVVVYDGQPIYNETKAVGRLLQVPADPKDARHGVAPDLMFGQIMGQHFAEPVLLFRFATRHSIWFLRGSRSLCHDYMPPSSGGGPDLAGRWDVIHFNWGIWDTAHREPATGRGLDKQHGTITTPIDVYEKNLRQLVARMKQTGATLIWANITPLHQGCPGHIAGDEIKYNAVAETIMKEHGVIIDDLNAESLRQGFPKAPDVHSVGHLAPKVTETILAALASRKQLTKPLPRVLMIGDSITGSYLKEVTKNLDGKAIVCKNPGNGEHTGTGVAKIEEWLDLKRYLQNGQEYLELVDGVKNALAQFERVYPGYQNHGVELAGLVWFQGIADSQSDAQSAAYEKNLANLIRDLRRDLKAPFLPVVVAAVGFGGTNMPPNTRKVFEAQMAVGTPAKYPEFVGNVKSIDTRAFYRPPEVSPSSQSACYNANAETFLEIGETMGRTMLELLKGGSK